MEKKLKYFGANVTAQAKWLNKMAKNGYRLVKTGKLYYYFEKCEPEEYVYTVDFRGDKKFASTKEYYDFLVSLGYKVYYKNINLNWSTGKVAWYPTGLGKGNVVRSNGALNRELLIVEKKNDGIPFELHTTNDDKANYIKSFRNAWIFWLCFFLGFSIWRWIAIRNLAVDTIVFTCLTVLCLIPVIRYQIVISRLGSKSRIEE